MNDDVKRGKFLAELRKKHNLKQSDLAKLLNYSDKSISKWERGICYPKDTDVLIKISNIFNVSIDELILGEYSDIEGINIPKSKNKILNFLLKYRVLLISIFIIVLVLLFTIYYLVFDFKISNVLIFNGGIDVSNLFNNFNDVINYKDDDLYKEDSYISISNHNDKNIKNNIDEILLAEGFTYEDFVYHKEINENVIINYYCLKETFRVYDNSSNEYFFVIYNDFKLDDFVYEKYNNDNLDYEYLKNIDFKDCNKEICDDYLDYAMYINYIKKLILE